MMACRESYQVIHATGHMDMVFLKKEIPKKPVAVLGRVGTWPEHIGICNGAAASVANTAMGYGGMAAPRGSRPASESVGDSSKGDLEPEL